MGRYYLLGRSVVFVVLVWFGMVGRGYVVNVGSGYVMNVGRGYVLIQNSQ